MCVFWQKRCMFFCLSHRSMLGQCVRRKQDCRWDGTGLTRQLRNPRVKAKIQASSLECRSQEQLLVRGGSTCVCKSNRKRPADIDCGKESPAFPRFFMPCLGTQTLPDCFSFEPKPFTHTHTHAKMCTNSHDSSVLHPKLPLVPLNKWTTNQSC